MIRNPVILLVYPHCPEKRIHGEDADVMPIGLYHVAAAALHAGYETHLCDWPLTRVNEEQIRTALTTLNPDIIGFSILHANRWTGIDIARHIKRIRPTVTTVFGGVGATFLWKHFLTHFPEIDYTVSGEGERPFLALVRCLQKGERPDSIPGLGCRVGGKPRGNAPGAFIRDLDTLPDPSRHFAYNHVVLTRGCASNCTFCGSPGIWKKRVRFHSAAYFLDQLERLYRKGIRFFYFSDDTFTLKRRLVLEICEGITARGLQISWTAISRINLVDEEILCAMRKAGCIQISYGVESGSAKLRAWFNKPLEPNLIRKAFHQTARYGILPRAYFIYGCPGENEATIAATLSLIREIRPLGAIFYILDLFPGTAIYESFKQRAGVSDDIWLERIEDIMYFETDPEMDENRVRKFGKALRDGFHAMLPEFIQKISLVDDPSLVARHADFCSRLALTFSHGDYAGVDAIPDSDGVAENLFNKALGFHPDARAYLGLAMLRQKRHRFADAMEILNQGLNRFPQDQQLRICAAITCMNQGVFERALGHLEACEPSPQVLQYRIACHRKTGDAEAETACRQQLDHIRRQAAE
jgi:anaerobic magnesium-protoporphyrin IX monomethyl ester cyclase